MLNSFTAFGNISLHMFANANVPQQKKLSGHGNQVKVVNWLSLDP
jgi:hypothetical protein